MTDTPYNPQQTITYKTYVKTALVEALRTVFVNHRDPELQRTKITIDYPRTEADHPAVVVRFFERTVDDAGVGHEEWIQGAEYDGLPTGQYFRFKHAFYWADIELAVYSLSSWDRDLISDSLVQILRMGELESYTNRFFERIYPNPADGFWPDSLWHFIAINTDSIQGFGESTDPTPWGSEDDLVYKTSYRVKTFGEFYSVPPDTPAALIEQVIQYPYIEDLEEVPEGNPDDDAQWMPPIEWRG